MSFVVRRVGKTGGPAKVLLLEILRSGPHLAPLLLGAPFSTYLQHLACRGLPLAGKS